MARIALTNGFQIIPEGTYIFKIIKIDYDEEFGDMVITMTTEDGLLHTEKYKLVDANGECNEKALNAFSYLAKTALNDFTLEEIDEQDLVGHYFKGTVVHTQQKSNKTGKMLTFANITSKEPADRFEGKPEKPKGKINDLLSMLG